MTGGLAPLVLGHTPANAPAIFLGGLTVFGSAYNFATARTRLAVRLEERRPRARDSLQNWGLFEGAGG